MGKKGSPSKGSKGSPGKGSKGSPGKGGKGSPGKNSKGSKGTSSEPPVEAETQTEFLYYCIQCGKEFNSGASIQAHTIIFDHTVEGAPFYQKCRACHSFVEQRFTDCHKCAREKMHFLKLILCGTGIIYGAPNICLLCRGFKLKSKSSLISHLISRHRVGRQTGMCGDCCFTFDETPEAPVKTPFAEEPDKPQPEYILPTYPNDMEIHYNEVHDTSNALVIKKENQADSFLRFPYVCPYCKYQLKNNAQFQSHIICVHGTSHRYEQYLNVCKGCNKPTESVEFLNHHAITVHNVQLTNIAKECMRQNLVQNYVPLAQTCTLCWMTFKYDFYLQAHILVTHIARLPFQCGLCKRDFSLCGTMPEIWQLMLKHEKNHYRAFHLVAIEMGLTEEPIPDEIPEVIDPIEPPEDEKTSKKGSPKDKKGKNSPKDKKSKDSPKSKGSKGSPKKSKK